MTQETVFARMKRVAAEATPKAFKTILWIFRITAIVSFVMFVLRALGILNWISVAVSPVFLYFGLPGEASLAYVSGYFINVYSCVAALSTLELSVREVTILGTMTLAAHAMILESAVQHKTGTSRAYCYIIRTLASLALGILLNLILPGRPHYVANLTPLADVPFFQLQPDIQGLFVSWLLSLLKLGAWMLCIIWLLNIVQRELYEFGLMEKISKVFRPLLAIFGLPASTSFLWIVANLVGLSYGSAAIMDEMERNTINRRDIDLLNTHIGISHSNLEDLSILAACGGIWYIILLSRWIMVTVLVWSRRLYLKLSGHIPYYEKE